MKVMKDAVIIAAAAWLGIGLMPLGLAHAQGVRQACRADYLEFCSGVQRGGGRIAHCLKSHAKDLSPECTRALVKLFGSAQPSPMRNEGARISDTAGQNHRI